MKCCLCPSDSAHVATLNARQIPICEACLQRALAVALPVCPTCGREPKRANLTTADATDQRLYETIAAAPELPAQAWRVFVKASGLGTIRAAAARDRLLASGRIYLHAKTRDGARLYRATKQNAPD